MDKETNKDQSSEYIIITENTGDCEICYGMNFDSRFIKCKCGHGFCYNCLTEYYNTLKAENDLYPFKCPATTCSRDITKSLKLIIDESEYKFFIKLRNRKKLLRNPMVRWCTTINCDGYGVKEKENDSNVKCNYCEVDILETENPENQEFIQRMSIIKCPGCKCLISRTFGCMKAKCYCGTDFCMKCEKVFDDNHKSWVCLASDNQGNISYWIIFFMLLSHVLVPVLPAIVFFWYRNNWDRNYVSELNEHPRLYCFLIVLFSPIILVSALFNLPFIWGWLCVGCLFEGRGKRNKNIWLGVRLFFYLPAVLLTFLGLLLVLGLVIAFAPLYGLGLLGYLLFNEKGKK